MKMNYRLLSKFGYPAYFFYIFWTIIESSFLNKANMILSIITTMVGCYLGVLLLKGKRINQKIEWSIILILSSLLISSTVYGSIIHYGYIKHFRNFESWSKWDIFSYFLSYHCLEEFYVMCGFFIIFWIIVFQILPMRQLTCRQCNITLPKGAIFCSGCGQKLVN